MSESIQTCYGRSYSYLGSTNTSYDNATLALDSEFMSTGCGWNSLMCAWNLVYVRYCDGASFSSDLSGNLSHSHKALFFRGKRIVEAVLDDLAQHRGLAQATDVVVSGSSAGALAVYLHIDAVAQRLSPHTRVRGLSDSGFFVEYEAQNADNFTGAMRWIYANLNASLNAECVAQSAEGERSRCMFAQNSAPFVRTPVLALQSQFDSYQIESILDVGYGETQAIEAYGDNLTRILNDSFVATNAEHAVVLDSCCHHTDQWNQIEVDGMDQNQILVQWYNGEINRTVWFQNESYPCDDCCKNGHTCN